MVAASDCCKVVAAKPKHEFEQQQKKRQKQQKQKEATKAKSRTAPCAPYCTVQYRTVPYRTVLRTAVATRSSNKKGKQAQSAREGVSECAMEAYFRALASQGAVCVALVHTAAWEALGTGAHALVVTPLRTLFFHGPALSGYGFLNGVAAADACAALTGISAVAWAGSDARRDECAALLERRFDSFAQSLLALVYLLLLGCTAARAWAWAWAALHAAVLACSTRSTHSTHSTHSTRGLGIHSRLKQGRFQTPAALASALASAGSDSSNSGERATVTRTRELDSERNEQDHRIQRALFSPVCVCATNAARPVSPCRCVHACECECACACACAFLPEQHEHMQKHARIRGAALPLCLHRHVLRPPTPPRSRPNDKGKTGEKEEGERA